MYASSQCLCLMEIFNNNYKGTLPRGHKKSRLFHHRLRRYRGLQCIHYVPFSPILRVLLSWKLARLFPLSLQSRAKKYRVQFNKILLILMNISSSTHASVWNLYMCYTHERSEWKFYGQLHSLATCLFYSQVLINLHPRCFDDEFNESLNFDDDFFWRNQSRLFHVIKIHTCAS